MFLKKFYVICIFLAFFHQVLKDKKKSEGRVKINILKKIKIKKSNQTALVLLKALSANKRSTVR